MSESFDWLAWHDSPEHAALVADLERDFDEAHELAREQAKKDAEEKLERIRLARQVKVEKPEYIMDFSEIRDDLSGHIGIKALSDWLKRK